MNEFHQQACAQGVPCALHHYLFVSYGRDAFAGLPKDECIKAFQYWVDNLRPHDSASHKKEHLMCPMLWCRDTFEDQLETLNHVPSCRWLSNTWYWCSICSRPETFMDCGGTGGQVPLQRKDSKLKRAMTFFKHFGRRTSIKGKIAWPTSPRKAHELADTSRYAIKDVKATDQKDPTEMDCVAKVHEMAHSTPQYLLPWPELPSRLSHAVQHELPQPDEEPTFGASPLWAELTSSQQLIAVQQWHEMYDPSTPIAELPSHPSDNVQYKLPQPDHKQAFKISPPCAELSARQSHTVQDGISRPEHGPTGATPGNVRDELPDIHSSGLEEWRHTVSREHDGALHRLVSPSAKIVSSLFEGPNCPSLTLPPQSSRATHSAFRRPEPICFLPQNRHRLWTGMVTSSPHTSKENHPNRAQDQPSEHDPFSYASREEAFSSDGTSTTMQPLIEELREHVFIVNNDWLQKLAPNEDLSILCSSSSVQNLFELGIEALKKFFDGTVVTSFVDVFALMHVACATAYILHKDDELYCWNDFWDDMLAWQYVIAEERERQYFVRVMDKLSTPQGNSILPAKASPLYIGYSSGALLGDLRNGRVVQDCSTMLDELDYGRIIERNEQLLPEHFASYTQIKKANIEEMIEKVTQPLQQKDGIEAFRNMVIHVESRLRKGLLRDPWEVEVALLCIGRVFSRSPQMYQRFQEAVLIFSDDAMGRSDPTWRNRYYATALEQGLAISLEIDRRQKSASPLLTHWPSASVLDVVRPIQATRVTPTSITSPTNESSASISPTSIWSASSMRSSQTSARESTLTSPITISTNSSFSISSPSSPISPTIQSRCHECNKTFMGTSRATNLQRHLKYDKPHNKVATFECFDVNCNKKFGRSDNRNQHFQGAHPSSAAVQLRRRGATKRRREVEDDAGREAIAAQFV